MDFIKRKASKNKKKKTFDDPIEQIMEDFTVDILPIHLRLPIMSID